MKKSQDNISIKQPKEYHLNIINYLNITILGAISEYWSTPLLSRLISFLSLSIFVAYISEKKFSKLESFTIGCLFGFSRIATSIFWIGTSFSIHGSGITEYTARYICSSIISLFLCPSYGIAIMCYCNSQLPKMQKVVSFTVLLSLSDWLRRDIIGLIPWGCFGELVATSDIIAQTASLFGALGLDLLSTFLQGSMGLFILSYIRREYNDSIQIGSNALLVFIVFFLFGFLRINAFNPKEETQKIDRMAIVVQANIVQEIRWSPEKLLDNFLKHIKMTEAAIAKHKSTNSKTPILVAWPETAIPYNIDSIKHLFIKNPLLLPDNSIFTSGVIKDINHKKRNSMYFLDSNGYSTFYDKRKLVPFGEFIPFAFLKKFIPKDMIMEFAPGAYHQNVEISGLNIGSLICYESLFPILSQENQKVDLMINSVNDAWFAGTKGPHRNLVISKIRSTELGIPMIRVSNSGPSAVINSLGICENVISEGISDTIIHKIPNRLILKTIYSCIISNNLLVKIESILFIILLLNQKDQCSRI